MRSHKKKKQIKTVNNKYITYSNSKSSPTKAILTEVLQQRHHALVICSLLACDAAEQTQAGGRVAPVAAGMAFCWSRWNGDRHGDRLVKLPPPGLHSDDGAEGGSVPKDRSHHVIWHRLGLNTNTGRRRKRPNVCLLITFWEMSSQTFAELFFYEIKGSRHVRRNLISH